MVTVALAVSVLPTSLVMTTWTLYVPDGRIPKSTENSLGLVKYTVP